MSAIVITAPKYRMMPPELEGHVVTVEHDAEKQREYPMLGRHYRVLLDGVLVGSVRGDKEMQHVKMGRLRRDTGYRMQWRGYTAMHSRKMSKAIGYPRDTRAEAAIAVAELWLQEAS